MPNHAGSGKRFSRSEPVDHSGDRTIPPCSEDAEDAGDAQDFFRMSYPASWWRNMWREALPSGNGVIGASVFGGVREETVLLNHAKLWHWGHKDELPDVSGILPRTRALMDEKRYREASWLLADALKEQGYGTKLASRFPLAAIRLVMPCGKAFRSYSRKLAMDSGEVDVSWTDGPVRYQRRLFVSRPDEAVVYELGSDSTSSVSGAIELVLHPSDRWGDSPEFKELERSVETGASIAVADHTDAVVESACESACNEGYSWFAAKNDDGTDYGAVMLVKTEGGRLAVSDGMIQIEEANYVLVLVRMFVKGERERDWLGLRDELKALAAEASYEELLRRHAAVHGALYRSATLELVGKKDSPVDEYPAAEQLTNEQIANEQTAAEEPANGQPTDGQPANEQLTNEQLTNERLLLDAYEGEAPIALIRRMWAYGRYLFISGTDASAEAEPFGLYGLWGGDYRLVWSHNMANENIQMMYWHAQVGGLGKLTHGLYRYYEGLMDDFRENAKKLYGCGGIYIPAGTTPSIGSPNQIVPVILNWTGAAGWLAAHYAEHYRFTGDERFLREHAIPFMREAVRFYEDFLVMDDSGRYRIYPSVSPENTPLNYMPEGGAALAHPMPTAINATMDVAILRELLGNLLEASRTTGTASEAEQENWERMREKLPPYEQNKDGAVKEWIHGDFEDRYAHRHLSHLYPVFPGHEVTRESNSELFEAFEKAVRKREIGAQSGWSLTHMASIYARLGDGDSALECLDILTRSSLLPNLFTLHNDWRGMGVSMNMTTAPVQLDANMGFVNAMQEMLLQVHPGMLKLLPALPERLKHGRLSGWRFHTGSLSMEWNQEQGVFRAELHAERDTSLLVKLPDWAQSAQLTGGEAQPSELGESYWTIRLRQGESVSVATAME